MKKLPLVCLIAATLAPSITFAHQAGDFLFRAGSVTVRPTKDLTEYWKVQGHLMSVTILSLV